MLRDVYGRCIDILDYPSIGRECRHPHNLIKSTTYRDALHNYALCLTEYYYYLRGETMIHLSNGSSQNVLVKIKSEESCVVVSRVMRKFALVSGRKLLQGAG